MIPNVTTKQERAKFYGSTEWRKLRQQCLERDHYECQWCKAEGRVMTVNDTILEVDHIQELEHHPELALELSNLRALCKDCHNRRHDRMNYRGEPRKRKWDDEWW